MYKYIIQKWLINDKLFKTILTFKLLGRYMYYYFRKNSYYIAFILLVNIIIIFFIIIILKIAYNIL